MPGRARLGGAINAANGSWGGAAPDDELPELFPDDVPVEAGGKAGDAPPLGPALLPPPPIDVGGGGKGATAWGSSPGNTHRFNCLSKYASNLEPVFSVASTAFGIIHLMIPLRIDPIKPVVGALRSSPAVPLPLPLPEVVGAATDDDDDDDDDEVVEGGGADAVEGVGVMFSML
jgi:hypothetical protein